MSGVLSIYDIDDLVAQEGIAGGRGPFGHNGDHGF